MTSMQQNVPVTQGYYVQMDVEMLRAARAALAHNGTVINNIRSAGYKFVGQLTWKTQDGTKLPVREMDLQHVKNTKKYCQRKALEWYHNELSNKPDNWPKKKDRLAFWLYYKNLFSLLVDNWSEVQAQDEFLENIKEIQLDAKASDKYQSFLDNLDI